MAKDSSIAAQRTPELPGLVKRGRPATGKAKTTAERQAAYRARKRWSAGRVDSEVRLNTMIAFRASSSLERLAFHYGVTKKEALERLLLEADEAVAKSFGFDSARRSHYIWSGKVDMTHPERPDQARLDQVLALEVAQADHPKGRDAVTETPPIKKSRNAVTVNPRSTKKRDEVTLNPARANAETASVAKSRDAVTKSAVRDVATGRFKPKSVIK